MLIDGSWLTKKIYKDIGRKLEGKRVAFVIFKDDPTSRKFAEVKTRAAENLGIETTLIEKDVRDTEETIGVIKEIASQGYDGMVVQLPLPENIDAQAVFDAIPQRLDIDVLGTSAKEDYANKKTNRVPPVAGAVEEIFKAYKVDLKYKEIIVLGKGRLVGMPVGAMLERNNVTYTAIDIDTPAETVLEFLKDAEIVVSGIGKPHFIKKEMLKQNAIVIDAGTSELAGTLAGDAHPDCAEVSSLFTPVPGGLGPITVAVLYRNLLY